VLFGTSIGYANDKKKKNVKTESQLYIKNASGDIIYLKENFTDIDKIDSDYDFNSLGDGLYSLEVIKGFEIKINPFAVANNEVVFIKNAEKIVFKPVFRLKNNHVLISFLDFSKSTLKIEVYYEGERIHKEALKGGVEKNRVYALDYNYKGDYKLVITCNGRTYKENFTL
jgi:hypothetical protein